MFPAKLGDSDAAFCLAQDGQYLRFAKSARLHQIYSIIKPEKILLLKPVICRGGYPCFGKPLGIANANVLNAPVRVMHEAAAMSRTPIMKCLLQSIEDKACMRHPARPPADDATSDLWQAINPWGQVFGVVV
jgi:hypothetical protein